LTEFSGHSCYWSDTVLIVTSTETLSTDLKYLLADEPNESPALEGATAELAALATAISSYESAFVPPLPRSIEQTGINEGFLEDLILKTLYSRGETVGRDLAGALGLKFSLIEPRVEFLKGQRLIQVKNSLGFGAVSAVFGMSDAGRIRVRECLEQNQYVGAMPVPIEQYCTAVRAQRLKSGWLTLEALQHAYRGMIVSADVLGQIGPAVNSGKSLLIYGQPGNGKSYLAEALCGVNESAIYVPYAIEYQGNVIKVFDPIHHSRMDEDGDLASSVTSEVRYDSRWARCRRPFIVTGGELSIDMLDLGYNSISKVYDAPFHLKANNGIYLIDDFGRQKSSPAELLNRWIVPMDRRVDYLSFNTGGKVEVPFDAFVIFSTNLQPEQLGDEAFLRRIQYKLLLRSPARQEFFEIFQAYCGSQGLQCSEALVSGFVEKHYEKTGKRFRRCHPRDVISHAADLIGFERLPMELTETLLNRAFESCFVSSETDE